MSNKKFFQLIPSNTNFDFIGKFPYFVVFTSATIIFSIVLMFTRGFNFGIDFTGGTVVQVKFTTPTSAEAVRELVEKAGAPDASVVAMGAENQEYLITARTVADPKTAAGLPQRLIGEAGGPTKAVIQQIDIVGPKVGGELKWAAIRSLFYSIVLIMIYIWLRFDFRFAPGATIAMVHDLIIATGFYLLTGREFGITAVAALLTIAGYSVNDTIVIYDRVREILKSGGDQMPLSSAINKAINLTLSRTILTALLTLISVVPVAIFCDGEIQNFAEAMIVGIFVGCYSTIYIAAPLTIYVQKYLDKDPKKKVSGRTAIASR